MPWKKISQTSILVNDPSKITFIVPADITAGDYKLRIGAQYTTAKGTLKEVKSVEADYIFNVELSRWT